MAFRIKSGEAVQTAVQRIAREQIDKAIGEIEDGQLDRHEVVHQVRKRCKKLRALVRLVRPQFEDTYKLENNWYRDSSRALSYVRDAQSIVETLDALTEHYAGTVDRDVFARIRRQLLERRHRIAEHDAHLDDQLAKFQARMHEGRERVASWRLDDRGFGAVAGGMGKTYERGRAAMEAAYDEPDDAAFHEWRKRVKYHWYHMRLLRNLWQPLIKARRDETKALGDLLGEDHDLAVLGATVLERPYNFDDEDVIQTLLGLARQRQIELRAKARPLGARLYAEKPKHFGRRLGRYWKAWQRERMDEPQAALDQALVSRRAP